MGFRFKLSDQSATVFLRRLAVEELGDLSAGAGVHDARKRVKKLRAALRLVRSGFGAATTESYALRDAAQGLSGARDAEVMLGVFDKLAQPGEAPDLRAHLVARAAAVPDVGAAFASFLAAVAPVQARAESWIVKGKTTRVLAEGLTRTRAKARHAMSEALLSDPEGEAMHEWRKRVKDLWYQARLFQPVWPHVMEPQVAMAGDLGELLGDHHDLVVFRALLHAADTPSGAETELFRDRASRRMAEITDAARPMSARLLAGSPRAVADQWVDWWTLWQGQA